ncbi:hypothetical protein GCM10023336_35160 [Streptomyces similanensis]|uniref:Uncharacterized protein n=1 Tax=Streptomyces similanensis TaxID=1274988 RepID=A0ABP9KIK1_9ACTN
MASAAGEKYPRLRSGAIRRTPSRALAAARVPGGSLGSLRSVFRRVVAFRVGPVAAEGAVRRREGEGEAVGPYRDRRRKRWHVLGATI